jgi:hypothetical protein
MPIEQQLHPLVNVFESLGGVAIVEPSFDNAKVDQFGLIA